MDRNKFFTVNSSQIAARGYTPAEYLQIEKTSERILNYKKEEEELYQKKKTILNDKSINENEKKKQISSIDKQISYKTEDKNEDWDYLDGTYREGGDLLRNYLKAQT